MVEEAAPEMAAAVMEKVEAAVAEVAETEAEMVWVKEGMEGGRSLCDRSVMEKGEVAAKGWELARTRSSRRRTSRRNGSSTRRGRCTRR